MFNLDPQLFDYFVVNLWPIITVFLLWIIITTYVMIRVPLKYHLKWVLIPLLMLTAGVGGLFVTHNFGYAAPYLLPDRFQFLGYKVENKGFKKNTIEVWINKGIKTRLYVIPYSKDAEDAFKEAAEKLALANSVGGSVEMESPGHGNGNNKGGVQGQGGSNGYGAQSKFRSKLILPPAPPPKDSQPPPTYSF